MNEYDYQVGEEELDRLSTELEMLTKSQLLEVSKMINNMKTSEEEKRLANAKEYFNQAILSTLQNYAEVTGSILNVTENEKKHTIRVSLRNPYGFDIFENNFRRMQNLFIIAKEINFGIEDEFVMLSLTFDYMKL